MLPELRCWPPQHGVQKRYHQDFGHEQAEAIIEKLAALIVQRDLYAGSAKDAI